MSSNKISFVIIVTLIAALAFSALKRTPAPAEIIPPEQSLPYAVFYTVCGKFQTILMTTEPPLVGYAREPELPELLDLLKATPLERILELRYVGPECFYSNPPSKEKESII